MSTNDEWTIGRLLQWTSEYLGQQGGESPRLDAEVLLAEARGCQRIELYTAFDEPASEEVRAAYRELVRRRAEGTPVAYVVGRREFYSHTFRVTPDVLIPRPETEFIVVTLLDLAKRVEGERPISIADVGTGSGILAICAALHIPGCQVTATDIDMAALEIARHNTAQHGVGDRVELLQGDLLAPIAAEAGFDFIVSNPPYVSQAEWESLATEVRDHEPVTALVAGPTGMEVIERLAPQAAQHLRPGGWLLLEVSPMIEEHVRELLVNDGRFEVGTTVKDLAQLPRVVLGQRN